MWSNVVLTTAMWRGVGRVVQCIHIIISNKKISYYRIRPKIWQQRRCPTSRTPSCSFFGDTRLAGASSLLLLSLLCCHRHSGAVKFVCYHILVWPHVLLPTYCSLHPAMSCNDVQCQWHIANLMQCVAMAMWRNVAQCRAMWDLDKFLLGFCYVCSSEKVSW